VKAEEAGQIAAVGNCGGEVCPGGEVWWCHVNVYGIIVLIMNITGPVRSIMDCWVLLGKLRVSYKGLHKIGRSGVHRA
jgi:hypothetical protein